MGSKMVQGIPVIPAKSGFMGLWWGAIIQADLKKEFFQSSSLCVNDTHLQPGAKFYGDAGVSINSPFVRDLKVRIYSKVDIR